MTERLHLPHASGGVNCQRGQVTDSVRGNGVPYNSMICIYVRRWGMLTAMLVITRDIVENSNHDMIMQDCMHIQLTKVKSDSDSCQADVGLSS